MLAFSPDSSDLKAKLFCGLADPTRLVILEALSGGPLCVGDLVAATGLSQPNVSNHLACLKDCGLVGGERQGRKVYYRTSDPRVSALLALARELLADVARGVYDCTRYAQPAAAVAGAGENAGSETVAQGEVEVGA
jgi:DNA-binding transcriptional ArsR family regulator